MASLHGMKYLKQRRPKGEKVNVPGYTESRTAVPEMTVDAEPGKVQDDWEARDWFDTLSRAREITQDKTKVERVRQHAKSIKEKAERMRRLSSRYI